MVRLPKHFLKRSERSDYRIDKSLRQANKKAAIRDRTAAFRGVEVLIPPGACSAFALGS